MFGVRHHDAVALLDDPGRDALCQVLTEYTAVTTYAAAVEALELPVDVYELGINEPDEPREYRCQERGFFGTGFHRCDCGATHEYHCVC